MTLIGGVTLVGPGWRVSNGIARPAVILCLCRSFWPNILIWRHRHFKTEPGGMPALSDLPTQHSSFFLMVGKKTKKLFQCFLVGFPATVGENYPIVHCYTDRHWDFDEDSNRHFLDLHVVESNKKDFLMG